MFHPLHPVAGDGVLEIAPGASVPVGFRTRQRRGVAIPSQLAAESTEWLESTDPWRPRHRGRGIVDFRGMVRVPSWTPPGLHDVRLRAAPETPGPGLVLAFRVMPAVELVACDFDAARSLLRVRLRNRGARAFIRRRSIVRVVAGSAEDVELELVGARTEPGGVAVFSGHARCRVGEFLDVVSVDRGIAVHHPVLSVVALPAVQDRRHSPLPAKLDRLLFQPLGRHQGLGLGAQRLNEGAM